MAQRGLTLIEILVVVLIISILSAAALLTISYNSHKTIENFSSHLAQKILLAEEEALLKSQVLGLSLSKDHSQFYEYNENEKTWVPMVNPIFNRENYPTNIRLSLTIHQKNVPLHDRPQIIIYSSGEISSFSIKFAEKNNTPWIELQGETNGSIKSQRLALEK